MKFKKGDIAVVSDKVGLRWIRREIATEVKKTKGGK